MRCASMATCGDSMKRSLGWWLGALVVVGVVGAAFAAGLATRDRASGSGAGAASTAAPSPSAPTTNQALAGPPAQPASATQATPRTDSATPVDALAQARALGVPVPELFDREARDGAWAGAVEKSAQASYLQTLVAVAPWADRVVVECRTALCKVTVPVDEGHVAATMNRLQVVTIAAGVSPFADRADDGEWYAGVYVRFDESERAAAMHANYWTDGVRARFPGGNAQLAAWLEADERRAAERQRAVGTQP